MKFVKGYCSVLKFFSYALDKGLGHVYREGALRVCPKNFRSSFAYDSLASEGGKAWNRKSS
jgi:hypothetical protein